MTVKSFVCETCGDEHSMLYQLDEGEEDLEEVECWVCGEKARPKGDENGIT